MTGNGEARWGEAVTGNGEAVTGNGEAVTGNGDDARGAAMAKVQLRTAKRRFDRIFL